MKIRTGLVAGLVAASSFAGIGSAGAQTIYESRPYYRSERRMAIDTMVRNAYLDLLGHEPSATDIRYYRRQVLDAGWTERDVRRTLRNSEEYRMRNASSRYDRYDRGYGSSVYRANTDSVDRMIIRAYRDVLGRYPDADGFRVYRDNLVNRGWSEEQMRRALRDSDEYRIRFGR